MNLAIVSPEYPPYNNPGGVATFNKNFANLLVDLKHRVVVFCKIGKGTANVYLQKNKVEIVLVEYKFSSKILNFLYFSYFLKAIRAISRHLLPTSIEIFEWNLFSYLALRKYHKIVPIDVAFCTDFSSSGLLGSLLLPKISWIQHVHGPILQFKDFKRKNFDTWMQQLIEKIDLVLLNNKTKIAHSFQLIQDLKKKYMNLDITYIKNFISENKKCVPSRLVNKNTIIYFGRIEKRKGVDELLKAFLGSAQKNKKLKLYLIGEVVDDFGEKNNESIFNVTHAHVQPESVINRVYFIPRIDQPEVLSLLIKTLNGIVVLPARYEPMGFTTIEALLLGQIVVTTKNSENLIEDGVSGFYCRPDCKSIKAVLKKINLLSQKKLFKIKANASTNLYKKFSYTDGKKAYVDLLMKVTPKKLE